MCYDAVKSLKWNSIWKSNFFYSLKHKTLSKTLKNLKAQCGLNVLCFYLQCDTSICCSLFLHFLFEFSTIFPHKEMHKVFQCFSFVWFPFRIKTQKFHAKIFTLTFRWQVQKKVCAALTCVMKCSWNMEIVLKNIQVLFCCWNYLSWTYIFYKERQRFLIGHWDQIDKFKTSFV